MRVNPLPDQKGSEPRTSIRMDARLDAMTRQKVDELAQHFHQPRTAVLGYIVAWGLRRGQTALLNHSEVHSPVRHLYLYVASDLHARVEKAAIAAGVKTAPWPRHMVRQIISADFPTSWQEAKPSEHSHDSRVYGTRFMLRLDAPTRAKLQQLVTHYRTSKAKIIRQLVAQAKPEHFPKSWHMRAAERRANQPRR
jgi:predicted transcriptional regulator